MAILYLDEIKLRVIESAIVNERELPAKEVLLELNNQVITGRIIIGTGLGVGTHLYLAGVEGLTWTKETETLALQRGGNLEDLTVTIDLSNYSPVAHDHSGIYVEDLSITIDPVFPIEYLYVTKGGVSTLLTSITKADGKLLGGIVSWVEGLAFSMSPIAYQKNGELYTLLTTEVTHDAADPDYSRIDIIVVDTTPAVYIIKGVAGENPQKPTPDPSYQLELTQVLIPAGSTVPYGVTDIIVYDENIEFVGSSSGVVVDFDFIGNSFRGSKSTSVGLINTGDTIRYTSPTPLNVEDYDTFSSNFKLKAAATNRHSITIQFLLAGVEVSTAVTLPFSISDITNWQNLSVAFDNISFTSATFDAIQFKWLRSKTGPNHTGFYLDYIKLQAGVTQQTIVSSVNLVGDVLASGTTGTDIVATLATISGLTPGSYGGASNIPQLTVDAKGRVTAIENVAISTADEKVKYNVDDTAAGYLADKIIAGTGISVAEGINGDVDKIVITCTVVNTDTDEKVKYDVNDPTAGYLADKIVAGTNITIEEGTGGDADKLKISAAGGGATTFLALTDTPAAYTGQAGKYPKVNAGENALEWGDGATGDFATKALDNLASVAINTSLISDSDSTDDLGSTTKYWANLYVDTIYTPAINGGAAANDDITIQGTSNATRTTSYVILQPNGGFVGIGTTSPLVRFDAGPSTGDAMGFKIGTFEIQPYNANILSLLQNAYFSSGWKRRDAGYATMVEFRNGVYTLNFAGTDTAGSAITWTNLFKLSGNTTDFILLGSKTRVAGHIDLPNTGDATCIKAGSFEIQPYNTNILSLLHNAYSSGGYRRREAGYASMIYWRSGVFSISMATTDTAGSLITWLPYIKLLTTGHFGIGPFSSLYDSSFTGANFVFLNTGLMGVGVLSPTACLHIKAGTATANTAPLKFTSGTLLSSPEAGAVEFLTDNLHVTISTGAARKGIVLDDGSRLTSGKIPIATTNGRLIDGQTPLAGTKVYYVADSSGGAVTRKLTFINGILTSET